jgi:hypothetical protein
MTRKDYLATVFTTTVHEVSVLYCRLVCVQVFNTLYCRGLGPNIGLEISYHDRYFCIFSLIPSK